LAALHALNLQVKERFDAEKLEFAFPTQTVFVKQEVAAAGAKSA
jgi:small-conductance mechanosensitive channel